LTELLRLVLGEEDSFALAEAKGDPCSGSATMKEREGALCLEKETERKGGGMAGLDKREERWLVEVIEW
jgi:hypothetical protein